MIDLRDIQDRYLGYLDIEDVERKIRNDFQIF